MPLVRRTFICGFFLMTLIACGASNSSEASDDNALLLEGIRAYQDNDPKAAIENFTRLLALNPNHPQARYYINLLASDSSLSADVRIKLLILGDLLARVEYLTQRRVALPFVTEPKREQMSLGLTDNRVSLQGFIAYLDDEVRSIQDEIAPISTIRLAKIESQPIAVSASVDAPFPGIKVKNGEGTEQQAKTEGLSVQLSQELLSLHQEVAELQSSLELNKSLLNEKQGMIDSLQKDIGELKALVAVQQKEFSAYLAAKDGEIDELKGILDIYRGKLADATRQLRAGNEGPSHGLDAEALSRQLKEINQFLGNRLNFTNSNAQEAKTSIP